MAGTVDTSAIASANAHSADYSQSIQPQTLPDSDKSPASFDLAWIKNLPLIFFYVFVAKL